MKLQIPSHEYKVMFRRAKAQKLSAQDAIREIDSSSKKIRKRIQIFCTCCSANWFDTTRSVLYCASSVLSLVSKVFQKLSKKPHKNICDNDINTYLSF